MVRRIVFWGLVVFCIIGTTGLMILFSLRNSQTDMLPGASPEDLKVVEGDWVKGSSNPQATLIEYSDFQCPACASYRPFFQQAVTDLGKDARFIYRHFPLKSIHKNAELAAYAAEAAGSQGKFWEMHDAIFEHQEEWASEQDARQLFVQYAERLELERAKFEADLDSQKIKGKVNQDLEGGQTLGVNATPTFFLNGKKINNPRTYEEFRTLIENEIKRSVP